MQRQKRITFIHTSPTMIPVFSGLAGQLLTGVQVLHMVDEALLMDITSFQQVPKATLKRAVLHVLNADQAGTDLIMVTCSSIGPAVQIAGQLIDTPVLRVDEPMAELAVKTGARIGVLATLPSTLIPTTELIHGKAKAISREIQLKTDLCQGAFAAIISGDSQTHDMIVRSAILRMAQEVDVIVLAQASMARVADSIPKGQVRTPILSSPRPAVERAALILGCGNA